jgi:hypothetical protein
MSSHITVGIGKSDVTKTTISTSGLSTCYFILFNFNINNCMYAYLRHQSKEINSTITAPKLLEGFLTDIWHETKRHLSKRFDLPGALNVTRLTELNLFVGGGVKQTIDVVRNAFSLLFKKDQSVVEIISLFESEDIRFLADQLFSKVQILNPITYLQEDEEIIENSSELVKRLFFQIFVLIE